MTTLLMPKFSARQLKYTAGALLSLSGLYLGTRTVSNDSDNISVEQNVDPLPTRISLNKSSWSLLGYGQRYVSFLKFKVYLLGVYINEDDVPLLQKVFNSKYLESFYETPEQEHKLNLSRALETDKMSDLLWQNAITSGVKFTARICALRNTDMGHLRDGFIRTITNSPQYKQIKSANDGQKELLDQGLKDLKSVFDNYKVNAKRNSNLFLSINPQGGLDVKLELFDGKKHSKLREVGTINEPLVAQVLFTCYLGCNKPLIQQVHDKASEKILEFF